MYTPQLNEFPKFNLTNLLTTCFGVPAIEHRVCILIDLPDLSLMQNFSFVNDENLKVQNHAVSQFLEPLRGFSGSEFKVSNVEMFAFKTTFGSNLDPDDEASDDKGNILSLDRDIYPNYDIILAITDFSLTAPLTAKAKVHGFRGATLHGLNDIILNSGLSVDYNQISQQAEVFRKVLTNSDSFNISFETLGTSYTLDIHCNKQEAQKSHGLCPEGKPDVANLPAGEVYFVPEGADGSFPFRYSDGTLAEMVVVNGKIIEAKFLRGNTEKVNSRNQQLRC